MTDEEYHQFELTYGAQQQLTTNQNLMQTEFTKNGDSFDQSSYFLNNNEDIKMSLKESPIKGKNELDISYVNKDKFPLSGTPDIQKHQ